MPAEQWEYLIVTLWANAEVCQDFLQQAWPGQYFPKFAPQTLMPLLDDYGAQGWELVAMEPVIIGDNGDILKGGHALSPWTNQYLCAFKRRKPAPGRAKSRQVR